MFERTKTKGNEVRKFYFDMNDRRGSFIVKFGIILLLIEINRAQVPKKGDAGDCSITINGDLGEPQPLILQPKIAPNGKNNFLYPKSGSRKLVVSSGQKFRVACPGSKLNLKSGKSCSEKLVECVGDKRFYIFDANIERPFHKITCTKYPTPETRPAREVCKKGDSYEIGFLLHPKIVDKKKFEEFQRLIHLCHDKTLDHTIYAHAKILATVNAGQTGFARTAFRKGNLFPGISPNDAYKIKSQLETIRELLGSKQLAKKYISDVSATNKPRGVTFLARGHLIAKSDFIYGSQQLATFFYANSVPMWQSINNGNWGIMEKNVRDYAANMKLDLDIWVGTIGIMTLKDKNNRNRQIYLHVSGKRKAIPVPKILFKVVYSEKNKSGIVFVTVNDPYMKKLNSGYRICKNVCNKINYMTWVPDVYEKGFSYCCEIDDFRKAFPNIPSFRTLKLLV